MTKMTKADRIAELIRDYPVEVLAHHVWQLEKSSEGDQSHRWIQFGFGQYESCELCGYIRREDRTNSFCGGSEYNEGEQK